MGETQKKEKTRGKRRRTVSPGERKRRFWHRVGLLVLIVLAIIAGVLAWFHFRPARASEEFAQQSPDLPLYVLVIGIDEEAAPRTNLVGLAAVNKEKKTIDFIMLPNNTKIEGRKGKGCRIFTPKAA
jgi:anionic cell wall polymer biosynthesis LytR-Cps2A-Psr (LCP) family protein